MISASSDKKKILDTSSTRAVLSIVSVGGFFLSNIQKFVPTVFKSYCLIAVQSTESDASIVVPGLDPQQVCTSGAMLGAATLAKSTNFHHSTGAGWLRAAAVLYNPSGIVLSNIQQVVLTNLEYFHLRVPSCRAQAKGRTRASEEPPVLPSSSSNAALRRSCRTCALTPHAPPLSSSAATSCFPAPHQRAFLYSG